SRRGSARREWTSCAGSSRSIPAAPFGISVNAIAPGPFVTNIAGGRMRDASVRERFSQLIPMQRVAQPDEIKGLALLLASNGASYMTGTVIPIDGGATAGA
ncbi:MAG: SDR family oxidoreductase, partial [Betaproteobacteria bacterium]|nr:SDR family oxidoreductase [Betaproteobacteria bacterium]